MARKFNAKLAIEMIKSSTHYECGNIDYVQDLNAISIYSKKQDNYGAWDIVSALEVVGYKCYARAEVHMGVDKIAIRVF